MQRRTNPDPGLIATKIPTALIKTVAVMLAVLIAIALSTYNVLDSAWSKVYGGFKPQYFNALGRLGAYVADVLIYFLGISAFCLPLILVLFACRKPRKFNNAPEQIIWRLRQVCAPVLLIASSMPLSLVMSSYFNYQTSYLISGHLGLLINEYLLVHSNELGAKLLPGMAWCLSLSLCLDFSWPALFKWQIMAAWKILNVIVGLLQYLKLKLRTKDHISVPKALPKLREAPSHTKKNAIVSSLPILAKTEHLPSTQLLTAHTTAITNISPTSLKAFAAELENCLLEFGVIAKVSASYPGPVVTLYELDLAKGQKISKITNLSKDLARAMSTTRLRVVEVIPGKSVIGLEVPNKSRAMVSFREIIESPEYQAQTAPLTLALGKDISGAPVCVDLAKMPHLLVAGTTGSGKSVGINAMLLSLLFKALPSELRLILIDPKMLELSVYDGIPHLLTPVVTDMQDAAKALNWCVQEMDRRYRLMSGLGVRNLEGYNEKINIAKQAQKQIYEHELLKLTMAPGQPAKIAEVLPNIVVIIDEFADMIMVVGKKVEELIARIAQKARAAGIHLILATQRPSVDVITGLIKANIPTRISFQVSQKVDSRTILDQSGAEQLLGHGDMLYLAPGTGIPIRVHGAYVSDDEVHQVVQDLRKTAQVEYLAELASMPELDQEIEDSSDELFEQAVQIVTESRNTSISHLQRRLKVGYNRAANLIENMEQAGILTKAQNGSRSLVRDTQIN